MKKVSFIKNFSKGNIEEAFTNPYKIVSNTYETGYQEQAYTTRIYAYPENNKITLIGSLQCPYYVKTVIALGIKDRSA